MKKALGYIKEILVRYGRFPWGEIRGGGGG